mgnify:CR=1 FL=1
MNKKARYGSKIHNKAINDPEIHKYNQKNHNFPLYIVRRRVYNTHRD